MGIIFRNIEAERAKQDLTREQFANKIGMTRQSLRKKINGGAFTSSELIILAKVTGRSIDYLLQEYE